MTINTLYKFGFKVVSHFIIIENCFSITHNTRNRRFEFMGNVLTHLLTNLCIKSNLLFCNAFIHFLRIIVKNYCQGNQDDYRKNQKMNIKQVSEWLQIPVLKIVIFKNDKNNSVDDKNYHHIDKHCFPLGEFFHFTQFNNYISSSKE